MEKEIRFALVMYGGVSLAVYMNGVTQEFFHLVRATSDNASGEPSGTERVYKNLARIANCRFVVDVASGSSAGGINAVFLGKALANGQDLERLTRMWVDQADLSVLWNRSWVPKSVLSGKTLYRMLFRALEEMDDCGRSQSLQREMDVFITSTDIQGLELPLPLADSEVMEKRHKNVFHLRLGDAGSDFARDNNSMLAFAARATSSFPVAFEPACLSDYFADLEAGSCFPDYVAAGADYAHRAFGDGGYLNNKPFNHAIAEIPRRIADLPIRRVLFYIEPTPECASGNADQGPPGPIQNSIEALITLHQYETIREDLQQVLERNRLVERVNEITASVDCDVINWHRSGRRRAVRREGAAYARRTLSEEVHDRGPGYAGYHRLKVRAVTDELARITGLPPSTVAAWRTENFHEEDALSSESLFLLQFDLGYRQRRLRFLIAKLDENGGDPFLRCELTKALRGLAELGLRTTDGGSMEALARAFRDVMIPAAEQVERLIEGHFLKTYFDHFEDYDQVTFPVLYETQVGEAERVEVFRISTVDARSVIDETAPGERRRKLAGTILFHFGAFLKREWRVNDMLWGRLDGAERIICCVLPKGSEEAEKLVREAHLAILRETWGEEAEAAYIWLKTGYECRRRIGCFTALRLVLRLAWTLARMACSSAAFCLH